MFIRLGLFVLVLKAVSVNGANILFVTPLPSPSHHIFHKTLALELVNKGHNVTILSHETEKKPLPANLTVITIKGIVEARNHDFDRDVFAKLGMFEQVKKLADMMELVADFDMRSEGFNTLWNYPKDFKFDLIMYDSSFGRFMYIFTERFHYPPSMAVVPFLLPPPVAVSFGSYPISAYDPYHSSTFNGELSLIERAYNALYTYYEVLYTTYISRPSEEAIVKKYFPELKSTLAELENRVSLVLCNTDPAMDAPKVLPPNVITIGGMHARRSRPLPDDLEEIINKTDSVILFSLGTNVRSDQMKPSVIKAFLKVFSTLPYTVLWKFESELSDLPENVIARKWLPQNDIMGHPKTKLIINHGGSLSSQEAIYHGVPIVSIPYMLDQQLNAEKIVAKGVGVMLNKDELTEETISKALNEVLNTDKYAKNMKTVSARLHDQPLNALDRAVFWIEYMLRNGNADHLSVPTRWMPVYQVFHLDILGICLGGLFLCILTVYLIIRCYTNKCDQKIPKDKKI